MAIIEKTVDGYGPYLYDAQYLEQQDYDWTYIGKPGEIDLSRLDPERAAELMDSSELEEYRDPGPEIVTDGGYAETNDFAFHTRDDANEFRDQVDDKYLAESDDRRQKTVVLSGNAPRSVVTQASGEAADSKAHVAEQHGQQNLTEKERDQIDFRQTNVPHARSVKALMQGKGVEDWISYYDPQLSVDEHRDLAENARTEERGDRLDADEREGMTAKEVAQDHHRMESEFEEHAREACLEGHDEACDELRDLGWSEQEINELEQYSRDAEDFARTVAEERRRAGQSPTGRQRAR